MCEGLSVDSLGLLTGQRFHMMNKNIQIQEFLFKTLRVMVAQNKQSGTPYCLARRMVGDWVISLPENDVYE
jgi:hypothetical protein